MGAVASRGSCTSARDGQSDKSSRISFPLPLMIMFAAFKILYYNGRVSNLEETIRVSTTKYELDSYHTKISSLYICT